jgi:putative transposase
VEVNVTGADIQDRDGAKPLLEQAKQHCPRVKLVWGDGAYGGKLQDWTAETLGWALEIVRRLRSTRQLAGRIVPNPAPGSQGFKPLPRRWVVERTFAWLGRWRRLSKDYEELCETTACMIQMVFVRILIARFAKGYF